LFSALPITAARLWVGERYARRYADAHAEIQSAFVRLLLPLAMMEGAFWGASVWLSQGFLQGPEQAFRPSV
ncbi:MAG TPA: hypothetical protein VGH84_13170, partial [Steroidobacteraceae bacterium]